jgi:hypothetical protein
MEGGKRIGGTAVARPWYRFVVTDKNLSSLEHQGINGLSSCTRSDGDGNKHGVGKTQEGRAIDSDGRP